jgi:ribonuclease HI
MVFFEVVDISRNRKTQGLTTKVSLIDTDVTIFSDGSGKNIVVNGEKMQRVGCGIAVYENGVLSRTMSGHYKIAKSSLVAELDGFSEALDIAYGVISQGQTCQVIVDCQVLIRLVHGKKVPEWLMVMSENVLQRYKLLGGKVRVLKVKSHSGNDGNEMADYLAKNAVLFKRKIFSDVNEKLALTRN